MTKVIKKIKALDGKSYSSTYEFHQANLLYIINKMNKLTTDYNLHVVNQGSEIIAIHLIKKENDGLGNQKLLSDAFQNKIDEIESLQKTVKELERDLLYTKGSNTRLTQEYLELIEMNVKLKDILFLDRKINNHSVKRGC